MISKEERAELRGLVAIPDLTKFVESQKSRIAELRELVASVTLPLHDFVADCDGTGGDFIDAKPAKLIASAVNAAPKLLDALDAADERIASLEARIAELEAAAQWRPMDTCPSGEWVFILMPNGRIADLKFHAVEGADGCWQARNGGLMRGATGDDFVAWLPIPALPEGGV